MGIVFRLPDDFGKPEFSTVTIQRDLFYGYDTLMENVSDPSHIDFAHHKVCIHQAQYLAAGFDCFLYIEVIQIHECRYIDRYIEL